MASNTATLGNYLVKPTEVEQSYEPVKFTIPKGAQTYAPATATVPIATTSTNTTPPTTPPPTIANYSKSDLGDVYKSMYDKAAQRTQAQNAQNLAMAQRNAAQSATLGNYNPQMAARLQDYNMSAAYNANQQANAALNDQQANLQLQQRKERQDFIERKRAAGYTEYADYLEGLLLGHDMSGFDTSSIMNPDGSAIQTSTQKAVAQQAEEQANQVLSIRSLANAIKNGNGITPEMAEQIKLSLPNDTEGVLKAALMTRGTNAPSTQTYGNKPSVSEFHNANNAQPYSIINVNGRPLLLIDKTSPQSDGTGHMYIDLSGIYLDDGSSLSGGKDGRVRIRDTAYNDSGATISNYQVDPDSPAYRLLHNNWQ